MPDTNPPSSVRIGIGLTALGISGAVVTALMGGILRARGGLNSIQRSRGLQNIVLARALRMVFIPSILHVVHRGSGMV